MWFLNLPTGLILVLLSPFLPESARFLQHIGRSDIARASLARFGVVLTADVPLAPDSHAPVPPVSRGFLGITAALTLSGLVWGLVNFGLLLWLPAALVADGRSVGASSALIARSTLLAAPTVVVCAWMFSAWSTKWSLITMTGLMVAGLFGLAVQEAGAAGLSHPLLPLALVILGSCGLISMLLPYAAENYPLRIRGRATGWVAACSKLGGLIAQTLSVIGAVPSLAVTILAITVPAFASALLIAFFGHETRGRDLHEIDAAGRRD
jgi:putative MFS transporter